MRVLHIHDKPPGAGGVRAHVELVERALGQAGLDVRVLRIAASRRERVTSNMLRRTYWTPEGWVHQAEILRAVRAVAPEMIHLHAGFTAISPPILSGLSRRWPIVATVHDVAPFCRNGDRRFLGSDDLCAHMAGPICVSSGCHRAPSAVGRALQAAHRPVKAALVGAWLAADQIVAPSRYIRDLAVLHGASPARLAVVPNFVCRTSDAPIPSDAPPMILFVGALTEAKGADLVVEALGRLVESRWHAAFVGDGPMRERLEQRSRELGIGERVQFHGVHDQDEISSVRRRSTFALFTSRIAESFGMAGLESLAASRPVVGFSQAGPSDWLLDNRTGLAAAPGDVRTLAERMFVLIHDRDLACKLGRQGLQKVLRDHTQTSFIERILKVYEAAARRFSERKGRPFLVG